MSVVVIAVATPIEGHEPHVLEAILAAIPAVHAEPGCERYALHRADGDREFVMVESWSSWDALRAHQKAEPLAVLAASLDGHLAAPLEIRRLEPVEAGVAEKGRV